MKLKIAIAAVGNSDETGNATYAAWEDKMRKTLGFGRIEKQSSNKVVAIDKNEKVIDVYTIDTEAVGNRVTPKPKSVDTLDNTQQHTPLNKTQNDVRVDPKLEKGA